MFVVLLVGINRVPNYSGVNAHADMGRSTYASSGPHPAGWRLSLGISSPRVLAKFSACVASNNREDVLVCDNGKLPALGQGVYLSVTRAMAVLWDEK